MASPSEEARSRQKEEERVMRPAAEQSSIGSAYGHGADDEKAGWGRFPPQGKRVDYPSGGPPSKR